VRERGKDLLSLRGTVKSSFTLFRQREAMVKVSEKRERKSKDDSNDR
jgi:hypothetical protein